MAIQKSYTKNIYGQLINFDFAYHKIEFIDGNKANINIQVIIYNDKNKTYILAQNGFSFIPDVTDNSPNFIKQGYEYLKTLPEYKNAIDILDEGQTV